MVENKPDPVGSKAWKASVIFASLIFSFFSVLSEKKREKGKQNFRIKKTNQKNKPTTPLQGNNFVPRVAEIGLSDFLVCVGAFDVSSDRSCC